MRAKKIRQDGVAEFISVSLMSINDDLIEARAEARSAGRAEGIAEGRAEGRVEGKAEGRAVGQVFALKK